MTSNIFIKSAASILHLMFFLVRFLVRLALELLIVDTIVYQQNETCTSLMQVIEEKASQYRQRLTHCLAVSEVYHCTRGTYRCHTLSQ